MITCRTINSNNKNEMNRNIYTVLFSSHNDETGLGFLYLKSLKKCLLETFLNRIGSGKFKLFALHKTGKLIFKLLC